MIAAADYPAFSGSEEDPLPYSHAAQSNRRASAMPAGHMPAAHPRTARGS